MLPTGGERMAASGIIWRRHSQVLSTVNSMGQGITFEFELKDRLNTFQVSSHDWALTVGQPCCCLYLNELNICRV